MNAVQGVCVAAMLAVTALAPQARAGGEVVGYIEAKNSTNPAPAAALKSYGHFEISPVTLGAPYAGQKPNDAGKDKLQADLDKSVQPLLSEWNAAGAKQKSQSTLKIEPAIRHIKTVSGASRFWAGGMAGGSALLVTVKLSDASGKVIAEPEFYQHANARAAGWSMGGADRAVFNRTAELIAEYLRANYEQPVGGPTGKP